MTHTRTAWGWIRPDGSYVVDSEFQDADHVWEIALGWPAPREIENAKRDGWRVARFIVTEIPE